jgi:hypothetical protein
MKKKIGLILALMGVAVGVWATSIVYSKYVVNEPALAYSKTYQVDLLTAGKNGRSIDAFAATTAYSSATIANVTFADGGVSTNTLTVADNTGLLGVSATDQITITSTAPLKNMVLFVNGIRLRAFYDWKVGVDTGTTAGNLAKTMNRLPGIAASASGAVVFATATTVGAAANSFTITKNAATGLTIASANFTGGVDNASVTINGKKLTVGIDISTTTLDTSSGTAKAISTAIMGNSALSAIIQSTWTAGGVVSTTSTAAGVNAFTATANPPTHLVWGASTFQGGTAPAWALNGTKITVTNHSLSTGLPILYTTGTLAIGGLTNTTTYFAILYDANTFGLATTSTGAVAGSAIVLTSTSTAGPHTYTLAALPITGTFGFKWQFSDDANTWFDFAVSSVTFASPYTAATTSWDFGPVSHRYIRVNESAGTAGGLNVQIAGTGKNTD